jgi:glycosyltransferase involved in cell wall biosynthesis
MKVSVCMAVYNGQSYLSAQLDSILNQLDGNDEVIIVDDASIDDSVDIISKYDDKRISLIVNDVNLGVIKTFERALKCSSGDLIFLSDQDDVWLPSKIEVTKKIFLENMSVTLVSSDAEVIDMNGDTLEPSYYGVRGKYTSSIAMNIIKNKYLGCTLAFRSILIPRLLPFPDNLPMHDSWIGLVSSIYGKNFYISDVLIKHRRHNANASRGASGHSGVVQMLSWRFNLSKNLLQLIIGR